MNIRQLRQFVCIAQTGNLSRAAKLQNISQPALTRSIQNLEESFGVELIERRANGVFLTTYGEHLLDYAQCMVNDTKRVQREISAMKSGARGHLSIGVGPVFSAGFLTSALDRLLAKGAHLEIRLVEGFVENLCKELRNGSLDAVLSLFPSTFDSGDLAFDDLCQVESVLAASAKHNLAGLQNICIDQLAECNWVIADQKYASNAFREFFGRSKMSGDVHHIRANSMRLIKNLVQESDYLTILPRILIESELQNGSMVAINGPVKPMVSVGGIATRNTGFQPKALNDFVRIVKDEFNFIPDPSLAKTTGMVGYG